MSAGTRPVLASTSAAHAVGAGPLYALQTSSVSLEPDDLERSPPTTTQGVYLWSEGVSAKYLRCRAAARGASLTHASSLVASISAALAHLAEVAAMSSVPLRKADSRHVKYGKCTLKAGYSSIAHCSYELAVHSLGPCWQVRTPPLYLALPNGTSVTFMIAPTFSTASTSGPVENWAQPGQRASVHASTGTGCAALLYAVASVGRRSAVESARDIAEANFIPLR
eukprot:CAMPEP_0185286796 /NCGR_PEP_ID=MMETSP1363-20130426/2456_1 /TAXON_ID=38817 /ORGANISM="Gephyrocapsa oceanica, Strain RCC1303" /LENGTH=223 /DNA_ID=CAMNT_0027882611 /DNA_START=342 /DNA_END=1009 /DNA_ORIENTATION=-